MHAMGSKAWKLSIRGGVGARVVCVPTSGPHAGWVGLRIYKRLDHITAITRPGEAGAVMALQL